MDKEKDARELTVSTRADGDALYATMAGNWDLADGQATFLQIMSAVRINRSEKVLIDGRTVQGEPATIERFFYGEFVAGEAYRLDGVSRPIFAYAMHEPLLDPMRLGETVALNRGMNVKVFDDYDEASSWLGIITPPPK